MSFSRNFDLNKDARRGILEVEKELKILGLQMEKEAGKILDKEGRNDTGWTKRNTKSAVDLFLGGLAARLTLGTNTDYAVHVHEGRKPGKVPYSKKPEGFEGDPLRWGYTFIYPWVKRKLRIADPFEIKAVGGAVAQKIMKEGIEGTPFLDITLAKFQDRFLRRAQKAYLRGFNS